MKNLRLYFYIILQMWKSINCAAEYETEDPASAMNFDDNTEETNFVDPYSFDYNRATKKMVNTELAKSLQTEDTQVSVNRYESELKECKDALNNFELEESFTRRLINLLLLNSKLKDDGEILRGSITLSGTKEQIEKLQQYGNGKVTMRQVDAILTDVMTPGIDIIGEALSLIDHIQIAIYRYGGILVAFFATLAVLLSIKYSNWTIGKFVIIFLSIVFLASYFMIWSQLIKNAEIEHFAEARKRQQPPIQCEPEKMSSWQRIVNFFDDGNECFKYYKAMDFNPYHEVTPLDALIEVFHKSLLQPIGRFGSGIGDFIDNSTNHLGFPMKWIVTIILYIGIIPCVIVFPFSIFGGNLGLSFGPFFKFFIGKGQTNQDHQQIIQPQQQQQLPQPPPAIIEHREPITVILQLNSNQDLQQLPMSTRIVQSTNDTQLSIAGGDSQSTHEHANGTNVGGSCKTCSCKETSSSSIPHVEKIVDLSEESTQSGPQRDERGDGDC